MPQRFQRIFAAIKATTADTGQVAAVSLIILVLYLKNLWLNLNAIHGSPGIFVEYFAVGLGFYALSIVMRRRPGAFFALLIVLDILTSLFLLANAVYCRRFGDYLSLHLFGMAHQLAFVWRDVAGLLRVTDLLYLADIPFACFLVRISRPKPSGRALRFAAGIFLASFLLLGGRFLVLNKALPDVFTFKYGGRVLMNSTSIFSFYLSDIFSTFIAHAQDKPIFGYMPNLPEFLLHPKEGVDPKVGRSRNGLNVIILQIESLGADVIGLSINGQEITPNLNRFSRKALYFDQFISQTLIGSTTDAEFATLTSYYTSQRVPALSRYAKHSPFSLPAFLGENGYHSVFFHANDGFFYNRHQIMKGLGFQRTVFADYFRSGERQHCGTHDLPFFLESARILAQTPEPFLAYLVTISGHSPYVFPDKEKHALILPDTLPPVKAKYFQLSHYADSAFGEFLTALNQHKLLNKSVILLFGDHPPPDIATLPHDSLLPPAMSALLEMRVPMLISWPGLKRPGHRSTLASQVDVSPTLLSVVGIRRPSVLLGNNLLAAGEKGFILRNGDPPSLLRGNRFYWGYLDRGFTNTFPPDTSFNPSKVEDYANILRYADFVLKKKK